MSAIVVGYVPKPEGRAALRRAAEEAKLRGVRLVVVHSEHTGAGADGPEQPNAELDLVRKQLGDAGIDAEVRPSAPDVDVAEDLIAAAENSGADFIVIGLRRRSPVGKLILGSNAQRILLDAPCPVLAVKAEDADDRVGEVARENRGGTT
ncbi:universal stress protein [Phytoactinopolyspora endophytica]|uniref:universal stress protein n=1 Tax=Phytoactinopolyspora endophytica TaxID=1642495 RepID=UPI00101E1C22|nr:universal stress protein [Phytoactinopolyspora endophytica]